MSESAFHNKNQLTFDSLFDDLIESDSQEEGNQQNIRFINQKRQNFPIQLAADFNCFMEFIDSQSIQLIETTAYISSSHLPAIHNQMSLKVINGTDQTKQENYPYIHFFYHIALSGNLMEIQTANTGKLQLKTTDRLALYHDLTNTEQYLFLLETFWIDVDWAKLHGKDSNPIYHLLPEVFEKITDSKSKSPLDLLEKEALLGNLISDWNYFFLHMEWFGFWICEEDQQKMEKNKQGYFVKKLTATPFGLKMISVLLKSREITSWNIPLRCEFGEASPIPGSKLPEKGKSGKNSQASKPFHQAFKSLFPENDLHRTLPRNV